MAKREPMRVMEGTARPHEPFWQVRDAAASESGEAEVEFYGGISEYSWWGDDITPAKFKEDLHRVGQGGPVTVRINSPGGEVFAASVIRSMIMEYPGRVTTRIDGLCASAATLVALAGSVVKMQDSGFFMIHEPWMWTYGTVDELKTAMEMLKTIRSGIVDTYANKTHLEHEKLAKLMAAETWMSAREACELGFVDEVITAKTNTPAQLSQAGIMNALRNYVNVPASLLAPQACEPAIDQQAAERFRAEVQILV